MFRGKSEEDRVRAKSCRVSTCVHVPRHIPLYRMNESRVPEYISIDRVRVWYSRLSPPPPPPPFPIAPIPQTNTKADCIYIYISMKIEPRVFDVANIE